MTITTPTEQERLTSRRSSTVSVYRQGRRSSALGQTGRLISEAGILEARKHTTSFALIALFRNPQMEFVPATLYLKAAGEGLFLTLAMCWIITMIFRPSVVQDNPLKARLGYNNLCIGWDVAPANYVAAIGWVLVSYMALRFCVMLQIRLELAQEEDALDEEEGLGERTAAWKYKFSYIALYSFAGCVCFFTLCLMISPWTSAWMHTIPFLAYIVCRWLAILSVAIFEWPHMTRVGRGCVYVYTVVSLVLPVISIGEYTYYDTYHEKSPWPWWITCGLDYSWFACLVILSKVIPNTVVVHRVMELAETPAGV